MLKTSLLYLAIAVSDINESARQLAQAGFTLKKPHTYKEGVQAGLVIQSALFRDGTSFQIVSPKKTTGPLSRYVKKLLKNGEGGHQVVLETNLPKNLEETFLKSPDLPPLKRAEHELYSWVSFKTESPFAHLAFLKWKRRPNFIDDLYQHPNGALSISKVVLRPIGDPFQWAKILQKAKATQSRLDFSGLLSKGSSFIEKVVIQTSKKPRPKDFALGDTTFVFENKNP